MSGNGEDYWRQMATETHAKLVSARKNLERVTANGYIRHSEIRDELLRACKAARSFVATMQRGGKPDVARMAAQLDAALSRAGGGG